MQAIVDALHVVEGRPVTSSRIVSEYFEKKHSDVVRAIEAISTKKPELVASRNFAQWSEQVEIGSGAKRTVTGYWMDRKGFCLLAMGFTGSKALEFKCAFYDEFDRMEKALSGESGPDFIDEAQQREIQRAVGRRAAGIGKNFSLIYGALKDRFDIPRYTCLQKRDFEAALDFIQKAPIMSREQWLQKEESERKRASRQRPTAMSESRKGFLPSTSRTQRQRTFSPESTACGTSSARRFRRSTTRLIR